MKDKLIRIYNNLLQVETKGNSTLLQASAIIELKELIESEVQNGETKDNIQTV